MFVKSGNNRIFPVEMNADFTATAPATFAGGYTLLGWEGKAKGAVSLTTQVLAAATFSAVYYNTTTQVLVTLAASPSALAPEFTINQSGPVMFVKDGNTRVFAVIKSANFSMTVPPVAGYTFEFWLDADTNSNPRTIAGGTLVADTTYTAYFLSTTPSERTKLNAIAYPSDGGYFEYKLNGFDKGTFTSGREFNKSDEVMLTPIANADYEFKEWLDTGSTVPARTVSLSGGGNVTVTAYFKSTDPTKLTTLYAVASPAAGGRFTYTLEGFDKGTFTSGTTFNKVDTVVVNAYANAGYGFDKWQETGSAVPTIAPDLSPGGAVTVTALFLPILLPEKYYYITATSDRMTTISPEGQIEVLKGVDQTFSFSAKDGYHIWAVLVDGRNLSSEEIDAGSYTFSGVNMNHSIQVYGSASPRVMVNLVIDITEGKGYAEYSVNEEAFQRYTEPIFVPQDSKVVLIAYADEGYTFKEWVDGDKVITTIEYTVVITTGPVKQIDLLFSGSDGNPLWWILAAILLLVTAVILIWFFLVYRRHYNVIKLGYSAEIVGKDRAKRKGEYSFSVAEGFSGTVSYRIGEDGAWEVLHPMPNGEYVVPKGVVVDKLTIEVR